MPPVVPGAHRARLAGAVGIVLLGGIMLTAHWYGLWAYFQQDDFVWLGLNPHGVGETASALFLPTPHGTLRPLSERTFFLVLRRLFGISAMPFRVVVFVTMLGNLILLALLVSRLSESRVAGWLAAAIWVVHPATVLPMVWTAAYYQILGAFCLLAAFRLFVRWADHGRRRDLAAQWLVFLLSFGVIELTVMYPFLAIVYAVCCARHVLRSALLLLIPAFGYAGLHALVIVHPAGTPYTLHFDQSVLLTLGHYLELVVSKESGSWQPGALVGAVLLALLVWSAARGRWANLVYGAWFFITIFPVLLIPGHVTPYYLLIPLIGLSALAGDTAAAVMRSARLPRRAAVVSVAAVVLVYVLAGIDFDRRSSKWWYERSKRVERLMIAIQTTHQTFPNDAILIRHVDADLYWSSLLYAPYRLIQAPSVYVPAEDDFAFAGTPPPPVHALTTEAAAALLAESRLRVLEVMGDDVRDVTP